MSDEQAVENSEDASATDASVEQRPSRARRMLKWTIRLSLLLAVGLFLLPWLLSQQPVLSRALSLAHPAMPENIRFESATINWFKPVEVKGLEIPDGSGNTLLTLDRLSIEGRLWDLLTGKRREINLHFEKPGLAVRLTADGSNLQQLIKAFQAGTGDNADVGTRNRSGTDRPFHIKINDGQMIVTNEDGTVAAVARGIQADLKWNAAGSVTWQADIRAETEMEGQPGRFAFQGHGPDVSQFPAALSSPLECRLQLEDFPLALVNPLLGSHAPAFDVTGRMTGELNGQWSNDPHSHPQLAVALAGQDVIVRYDDSRQPQPSQSWSLPQPVIGLLAAYDPNHDRLDLRKCRLDSQLANLRIHGTIDQLRGEAFVDLQGSADQDLTELVKPWLAGTETEITVQGLRLREFSVRGPVSPPANVPSLAEVTVTQPDANRIAVAPDDAASLAWLSHLNIDAAVSWDAAHCYGIVAGQSRLSGRLAQGVVRVNPDAVPLSGGRLISLPELRLHPGPSRVTFERGTVLENVAFTEAMCRTWLKYISPPMAETTSINGRFTLATESGEIPLDDWSRGHIRGGLLVHSAEIGPSPFADGLVGIVQQLSILLRNKEAFRPGKTWIEMNQTPIAFAMHEGRVFHEGLMFNIGDVTVRTSGSVGLDESLDLVAEIPIPESLIKNKLLRSLASAAPLRVPIRGTLNEPRFDTDAMKHFTRNLGKQAAGGLLQQLIDR